MHTKQMLHTVGGNISLHGCTAVRTKGRTDVAKKAWGLGDAWRDAHVYVAHPCAD